MCLNFKLTSKLEVLTSYRVLTEFLLKKKLLISYEKWADASAKFNNRSHSNANNPLPNSRPTFFDETLSNGFQSIQTMFFQPFECVPKKDQQNRAALSRKSCLLIFLEQTAVCGSKLHVGPVKRRRSKRWAFKVRPNGESSSVSRIPQEFQAEKERLREKPTAVRTAHRWPSRPSTWTSSREGYRWRLWPLELHLAEESSLFTE